MYALLNCVLKHVFYPHLVGLNEWIGWDQNSNYVTYDKWNCIQIQGSQYFF